jgi:hypothetical protein
MTLVTSGFGLRGRAIRGAGEEKTAPAQTRRLRFLQFSCRKLLQLQ